MRVTEFPIKTKFNGNDSLYLKLIDTPGLQQHEGVTKTINQYIESKLILHHNEQEKIRQEWAHKDPVVCKGKLSKIIDNRVHLVLYFFTANRCKQTDV